MRPFCCHDLAQVNAKTAQPDVHSEPRTWFTYEGDLACAMRTTLAGIAALFVAIWLHLDTPRCSWHRVNWLE
jgi:hypothetical protein